MNKGDAQYVVLSVNIDGKPLEKDFADNIELTFNSQATAYCVQKSLKKGTIVWSEDDQKYIVFLTQMDTFKMKNGVNTWQLRVSKDRNVISTTIGSFMLGDVNSKEVI